jgi:hypothetical protein
MCSAYISQNNLDNHLLLLYFDGKINSAVQNPKTVMFHRLEVHGKVYLTDFNKCLLSPMFLCDVHSTEFVMSRI